MIKEIHTHTTHGGHAMRIIPLSLVQDALNASDVGIDAVYHDYSGRGMYGDTCFGICGRAQDLSKFLIALSHEAGPDGGDNTLEIAYELADAVRSDSMGVDEIFYFPGWQLDEKPSDDEDEEV